MGPRTDSGKPGIVSARAGALVTLDVPRALASRAGVGAVGSTHSKEACEVQSAVTKKVNPNPDPVPMTF